MWVVITKDKIHSENCEQLLIGMNILLQIFFLNEPIQIIAHSDIFPG